MKNMILALSVILSAQSAFAHTYNCEQMADAGYQVRIDGDDAQLVISNFALLPDLHGSRKQVIDLDKTFQGVDGATWEGGDYTFESMNGRMTLSNGSDSVECQ